MQIQKIKSEKNLKISYYIYLDYSEKLVGYIIVENEKVQSLLPKITKLHHYKDIKYKKAYLQAIKRIIENNRIADYLLKCKIKELKDNLSVFVEIIEFIQKHGYCKIFASVDDNQFNSFIKLLDMVQLKSHVKIVKESELKKGSVEYRLSLIIDTMLNIERMSK